MGVKLGHEVGYTIIFEDYTSHMTVLKYMTNSVLLQELRDEHDLKSYSVIMVEEVQERTVSSGILLQLLKKITRSNFKILISSTTLDDMEKFIDIFECSIFKIRWSGHLVDIDYLKVP